MITKVCERCKKEFITDKKRQRFCCYECFNKARVKYDDIECLNCGKIFHPKNGSERFCSRRCAYDYHSLDDKICPVCWESFHSGKQGQKYCSKKCYWLSQRLSNIICPICKKEFKPKSKWTKYCSVECRIIGHRLSKEQEIERNKRNTTICPICNSPFVKKRKHQIYCSRKCSLLSRGAESKENKKFLKLLNRLWYTAETEFPLWGYYFDFKIGNTLIELNPFAFHNSTRIPPLPSAKPKEKMYHYNKYQCAVKWWYKCIMVRDRTINLLDMLKDEFFHYEWLPQLHYYHPETKEHIIDNWLNRDEMISSWFLEIRDCGKETFSQPIEQDASNK